MNLNVRNTSRRAFYAAFLVAEIALVGNAQSKALENGKKAEVKGVIISRSGDLVRIQEKKSGDVELVKMEDGTVIELEKGLLRHTNVSVTALVPCLTIKAKELGNAEGQLEATKIKFNPDLFAAEIAEEQQILANEGAVEHAQTLRTKVLLVRAPRGNSDTRWPQTHAQARETPGGGSANPSIRCLRA